MALRFPPPPWLRSPPHRTLAEVELTWHLESLARRSAWRTKGWTPKEGRARLAELRARAVEPDRDEGGSAA